MCSRDGRLNNNSFCPMSRHSNVNPQLSSFKFISRMSSCSRQQSSNGQLYQSSTSIRNDQGCFCLFLDFYKSPRHNPCRERTAWTFRLRFQCRVLAFCIPRTFQIQPVRWSNLRWHSRVVQRISWNHGWETPDIGVQLQGADNSVGRSRDGKTKRKRKVGTEDKEVICVWLQKSNSWSNLSNECQYYLKMTRDKKAMFSMKQPYDFREWRTRL